MGSACTLGGGGGGGCGPAGGCAREGDGGVVSSAAERHRAADWADERPGMAKIGRGARGAQRGRIPPSIIDGGESWWRRGGAPSRPLAVEPDRDGLRRRDTGGAGGAGHRGSGGRVPGGCGLARRRPGGPPGGGW